MSDGVLIAVIGIGAAAAGGLVGVFGSMVAARSRIQALEIAYEQRLEEKYLSSAKEYKISLYMPLATSMATLGIEFGDFQSSSGATRKSFVQSIERFSEELDEMILRGASALMIAPLDKWLVSFRRFLCNSVDAEDAKVERRIEFSARMLFSAVGRRGDITVGRVGSFIAEIVKFGLSIMSPVVGIGLGFPTIRVLRDEIIRAPLESREFESRFLADSERINTLIKEVTLGASARA